MVCDGFGEVGEDVGKCGFDLYILILVFDLVGNVLFEVFGVELDIVFCLNFFEFDEFFVGKGVFDLIEFFF